MRRGFRGTSRRHACAALNKRAKYSLLTQTHTRKHTHAHTHTLIPHDCTNSNRHRSSSVPIEQRQTTFHSVKIHGCHLTANHSYSCYRQGPSLKHTSYEITTPHSAEITFRAASHASTERKRLEALHRIDHLQRLTFFCHSIHQAGRVPHSGFTGTVRNWFVPGIAVVQRGLCWDAATTMFDCPHCVSRHPRIAVSYSALPPSPKIDKGNRYQIRDKTRLPVLSMNLIRAETT